MQIKGKRQYAGGADVIYHAHWQLVQVSSVKLKTLTNAK